MEEHLSSFIIATIIYGLPLLLYYNTRFAKNYQEYIFLYLFFLGLIFLKPFFNEVKFANFFAYDNIINTEDIPTFYLNSILLYPIYLFIQSKEIVFGLNAFLSFIISIIAYNSFNYSKNQLSTNTLIAVFILPNIYFSFYGLRDQIILIILFFLSKGLMLRKNLNIVLLSLLLLIIRPELIIITPMYYFWKYLSTKSRHFQIIFLALSITVAIIIFPYTGFLLGIGKISDPLAIINFAENRYLRHAELEGGGSHILGGKLFNLNLFIRYPIQVLAFFINPLPFDFNSLKYIIPLFDSAVFFYFLTKLRKIDCVKYSNLYSTLILTILILSIFSSNYGNLFRLRYPFYGIIFSIINTYYNEYNNRRLRVRRY